MLRRSRAAILGVAAGLLAASAGRPADIGFQPAPALEVRQLPERPEPGGPLRLTLVVANPTSAAVDGVTLTAAFAPACAVTLAHPPADAGSGPPTWTLGRLQPGEQRAVTLQLAPPADPSAAAVTCKAAATYTSRITSTATLPLPRPQLDLEVTGPDIAPVGTPTTFVLTVRNRGSQPVQQAALVLQLAEGLGHPGGPELENVVGTVPAGETRQVKLELTPTRTGPLAARVRVAGAGVEGVERKLAVRGQDVRLGLTLRGPGTLYPDWPAVYELTVTNEGADPVPGVRPAVQLPRGLAFVRATDPRAYDPAAHAAEWAAADLAPGASRTVVFQASAARSGDLEVAAMVKVGGRAVKTARHATRVSSPGGAAE